MPWPQVRIAPNWMSGTNQQVRARQLWGSDVYTEDSDLVAALMHSGFYSISLNQCPPTVRPL
jgi:Histone deacetylation protein Rxt3